MLDLWKILPVVLCVYFSFLYLKKNYRLNYFRYIFFALFPYINSNVGAANLYSDLTHMLSIIIILVFLIEILKKNFLISKLFLAYVCFILYVMVSGAIIYPDNNYFIGIRNIIIFSMTVLALFYQGGEYWDEFKYIAQINIVVMSLCVILQFMVEYPTAYRYLYTYLRLAAFTGKPNVYASMILIYLFFSLVDGKFKKNIKYYIFALVAIVLSGSISGTLGFLILCIDFKRLRGCLRKLFGLFVIGIIVFMATIVVIRWQNPIYYNHLFASQEDRMSLWALFLNAFQEKPIFGHGWYTLYPRMSKYLYNMPDNSYTDYLINIMSQKGAGVAPHNDLIKLLAETGLIGVILCICVIFQAYKICYEKKALMHIKILTVGIVFFLTQNIIQSYEFWLFFFIPLLLYERIQRVKNKVDFWAHLYKGS